MGRDASSPAAEGDAGEDLAGLPPPVAAGALFAALLDVAGRLSAATADRVVSAGGPVTVTLSGGCLCGVDLDPGWLAGAAPAEIGRRVTVALRRAGAGHPSDRAVAGEAVRLGADPVRLLHAVGVRRGTPPSCVDREGWS